MEDALLINSSKNSERRASASVSNSATPSVKPEEENTELISDFLKIEHCSILKYGIKPSTEEISYGYCLTCDINLIHPICSECLDKCHQALGHSIKFIQTPGNIICGCGERMHKFRTKVTSQETIISKSCPYNDYCKTAGLETWYLVGTKSICPFCYMNCGHEGKGFPVELEQLKGDGCQCESLNNGVTHTDLKGIYHKMDTITNINNVIMKEIGPIKIINMIFLGEPSYFKLYANFDEMLREFNELKLGQFFEIKENFLETNFFLALKNFTLIVNKIKSIPIRYFSKQIVDKISFSMIEKVITYIQMKDTKQYWGFIDRLLYLYKKIGIGHLTRQMDKYKLFDLENFSIIQRKCIFYTNSSLFPTAKRQIEFFIENLTKYLSSSITHTEGYEVIIQICSILKRLSEFYLFPSKEMIVFCFEFEKSFEMMKGIKNIAKQIQLNYIIIKMLHYFVFAYNDDLVYDAVMKKESEVDKDIPFLFTKTELGRLISRNVIRIMYFCYYDTKTIELDEKETKIVKKILRHGIKIMTYLITPTDDYMIAANKVVNNGVYYYHIIQMSLNDPTYQQILTQQKNIEESYQNYYTFQIFEDDLISECLNALRSVMSLSETCDIKQHILKSNFFFSITKIFNIITFFPENEVDTSFIKLFFDFVYYFVENNSDNALIMYSHYIMKGITLMPYLYGFDVLKFYDYCADLIVNNDKVITFSKHIIKVLFRYLQKINSEKMNLIKPDAIENQSFDIEEIINLFLNIMIKLVLRVKQFNRELSLKISKKVIFKFLNEFKFEELSNLNTKYLLMIVNSIFDSSSENDRKIITSLINLGTLIELLKDYSIELDLRLEILKYLQKFKFNIYYTSNITTSIPVEETVTNNNNTNNEDNSFEAPKNNEYLNVFDGDRNNFENLNQNPLVSNYQYPTKYLTMYFNMLTINSNFETENITVNDENIKDTMNVCLKELEILENEIMNLKGTYLKHSTSLNKFMNYFVKGIIIPLSVVVKKIFCFTHLCDGNTILSLYKIAMDILYFKNYFCEQGATFLQNLHDIHIAYFNLDIFLNRTNQVEALEDYFELKECNKFSPFDYTRLYVMFEKHLFSFLTNPRSLELNEKFGSKDNDENCNELFFSGDIDLSTYQNKIQTMNTLGTKMSFLKRVNSIKQVLTNLTTGNNETNNKLNEKEQGNSKDNQTGKKHAISDSTINRKLTQLYNLYINGKNDIDETKSSLFVSLPEICMEYEKNFRRMFIAILIYLSRLNEEFSSECYMILYKLLSIETGETQVDIMEHLGGASSEKLGFLINFSDVLYAKVIKIMIGDFTYENSYNESTQIIAYNLIKIFKFLCEEHNNFFQEKILTKLSYKYLQWQKMEYNNNGILLTERATEETSMTFFNFMINILNKICLITNKAKEEAHVGFYYDLIYGILELLVEIIQGNKKEIIIKKDKLSAEEMVNNKNSIETFKNFVQNVAEILFDDSMSTGHHFKVRLLLMSFFISILEEKTNEDVQKIIMKFLTLNRVLNSIIYTMKNYFYENTKDDPKYKLYYNDYSEKEILQKDFKFDFTMYSFFKHEYFHSDFSKSSDEFTLANNYYRYIKLLSLNDKLPEASNMIKQVEKISETESKKKFLMFNKKMIKTNEIAPINLINEKEKNINLEFIEHYYSIKFFEIITKVVEVRLPHEKRKQLVIFTVPSEMIYLSEMTKVEFEHNVDRTSETSKKSELLKNIPLFQKEINYYKKRKLNWFTKIITHLDYIYVQLFVYMCAVVFNILMIFTLQGYKGIEENEVADTRRRNLRSLIHVPQKITDGIDLSIKDWGVVYDIIAYIFVALNGLLILSWIIIKMPLYYRLDRLKYMQENKIASKKDLTIWNKMYIAVIESILSRDYINSLLYMFILGLVGSIMDRGEIIYSFFLLAIIDLNPTLKNMILSIRMRYGELGASALLMVVLVYFYTNIGFFFFNDDYEAIIETEEPDNFCYSLAFCFLTNIDAGIRARGGAADQMIRVSFERSFDNYVKRIVHDVTYFLICIIIMIDLVFGIIIGTFSEMRSEEIMHQIDRENHCFICHVTREIAEKNNREDFQHHREITHNLWNYVDYMIFLKFSDLHDLNAANAYARTNLDEQNICFLPSSKDYDDDNEGKEKEKEGLKELDKEQDNSEDSFMEKEEEYEEDDEEMEEKKENLITDESNKNDNIISMKEIK